MSVGSAAVGLHGFEVVSNDEVAEGVFRLVLRSPEVARSIVPGQFMNLRVPGDASHILRIPLSFSHADAQAGTVEVVYAVVGEGTGRLSLMRAGKRSDLIGPAGTGWRGGASGRALLVAGGVGAPPLVAAAGMLAKEGTAFDAILGAQSASRLWGRERLLELGAGTVTTTTDDGTAGLRGLTTDAMAQLLAARTYAQVYTCGPAPMMAGVARLAAVHDIACQVSCEQLMGCGFGVCACCNVRAAHGGYKSCCTDGPVFDAREVVL